MNNRRNIIHTVLFFCILALYQNCAPTGSEDLGSVDPNPPGTANLDCDLDVSSNNAVNSSTFNINETVGFLVTSNPSGYLPILKFIKIINLIYKQLLVLAAHTIGPSRKLEIIAQKSMLLDKIDLVQDHLILPYKAEHKHLAVIFKLLIRKFHTLLESPLCLTTL